MSTLKNKLKKLSFFTHYPKEHESITYNNVIEEYPSKEEMWDEWLTSQYDNGELCINDINQKILVSTGGTNKCGVYYTVEQRGSQRAIKLYICDWMPQNITQQQNAYARFGGISTQQQIDFTTIAMIYGTIIPNNTSPPTSGTITVEVPSYQDDVNNIFYTGVTYKVNFTNLTESVQYYDVEYIDDEEDTTSPSVIYQLPTNSTSSLNTINGATLTWDSAGYYTATNNGNATFEAVVLPMTLPSNVRAEVSLQILSSGTNIQPRFGFSVDNTNGYYYGIGLAGDKISIRHYYTTDPIVNSSTLFAATVGTWYNLRVDYNNGVFIGCIYNQNDELLLKITERIDFTPVGISFGMVANNVKINFKDLKIFSL